MDRRSLQDDRFLVRAALLLELELAPRVVMVVQLLLLAFGVGLVPPTVVACPVLVMVIDYQVHGH